MKAQRLKWTILKEFNQLIAGHGSLVSVS
jgi:hypothetical protein